ncbi:hypothetical protein ISS09_05385 [Candidatus Woesearchaeota archaeon]|nr:hypothetical protein [Candidatus Woesearchaeota archaeon]
MKIGILGPTRIDEFCEVVNAGKTEYLYFLEQIAEYLASTNNSIVIMPSRITAQGVVALTYKDLGGKKVIGVIPEDDVEWGIKDIDESVADEVVNCETWRNQPEKLCEESNIFLLVGMSPGAMIEVCYSKWFKVKKVFIMTDFLSQKLPAEVEKDLDVEYITLFELKDKIK